MYALKKDLNGDVVELSHEDCINVYIEGKYKRSKEHREYLTAVVLDDIIRKIDNYDGDKCYFNKEKFDKLKKDDQNFQRFALKKYYREDANHNFIKSLVLKGLLEKLPNDETSEELQEDNEENKEFYEELAKKYPVE
eukprot:gene10695-3316_t